MSENKADVCEKLETRIPELPHVMRNQGWTVAPLLMERWLNLGANSNPEKGVHDTMTVKMRWVLMFPVAATVYNTAYAEKVWVNEAAQKSIIKILIRSKDRFPAKVGEKLEIGNVGEGKMLHPGNVIQFHKDWQIQLRPVEQSLVNPQINDLYGALGDFYFYYLVKGWVERLENRDDKPRYKVSINKVGVYVRDSYDFNDKPFRRQPLGFWGCKPPYIGNRPWANRYYVENKDFREWRNKHGKGRGGDFMLFSDIKIFDTNDSFEFSE